MSEHGTPGIRETNGRRSHQSHCGRDDFGHCLHVECPETAAACACADSGWPVGDRVRKHRRGLSDERPTRPLGRQLRPVARGRAEHRRHRLLPRADVHRQPGCGARDRGCRLRRALPPRPSRRSGAASRRARRRGAAQPHPQAVVSPCPPRSRVRPHRHVLVSERARDDLDRRVRGVRVPGLGPAAHDESPSDRGRRHGGARRPDQLQSPLPRRPLSL